jgi:hypothetical protein
MSRHFWQASLAVVAWTLVLVQVGVPLVLAVLIPMDVALFVAGPFAGDPLSAVP